MWALINYLINRPLKDVRRFEAQTSGSKNCYFADVSIDDTTKLLRKN